MTCKQCVYFKKHSDLKKCEPNETNGMCYLTPPVVLTFNGQITYARPGIKETDKACKNIEEK